MNTRTRALALITAVLALLFGSSAAANAADEVPRSTTLVAWLITAPDGGLWPGQVYTTSIVLDEPSLDALDGRYLPCGRYQVDLYWSGPTTDALIAGGILNGPSDPAEDLAYGAVEGDPWKYLTVETCPTEEPTPTETPTEPTPTPTETAPVVVTTTPEPTVVAEVSTVARTAAPTAPVLAATGIPVGAGILAALVLIVAGVTLVAIRGRRSPR